MIMKPIRVVSADDYPSALYTNRHALQEANDIEIVEECEKADEIIPALSQSKPDILLLDLSMPTSTGAPPQPISLIKKIAAKHPNIKIIVITGYFVPTILQETLDSDIRGYIMKDDFKPEELAAIIRQVVAGHLYISPMVQKRFYDEQHSFPKLTEREVEVIEVVAKNLDCNAEQQAGQLSITKHTLRNHLVAIYKEMDVTNKTHCVAKAMALGIIQPPSYHDFYES